jgi:hypothetical protein
MKRDGRSAPKGGSAVHRFRLPAGERREAKRAIGTCHSLCLRGREVMIDPKRPSVNQEVEFVEELRASRGERSRRRRRSV